MRFLLVLIFFFSVTFCGNAQPDPAFGKIVYNFSQMRDTNNPSHFYKEEMMLLFSHNSSMYKSYTRIKQDSIREDRINEAQLNGSNEVNMGVFVPTNREQLFTFKNLNNRYVEMEFANNKYLITQPLEKINWQIKKDTKKIAGYSCQKAACKFKGRNYTAWFSTEIPVSFGPWKLQGLPGLILEAYDDKKQVNFMCETIVLNEKTTSISLPADATKTNMDNYNRMVKAYTDNPNSADYNGIKISVDPSTRISQQKKFKINNPIELDDK
ncbi:MAG: GLPGLI family protein [Parafilimonas sp.]